MQQQLFKDLSDIWSNLGHLPCGFIQQMSLKHASMRRNDTEQRLKKKKSYMLSDFNIGQSNLHTNSEYYAQFTCGAYKVTTVVYLASS